MIGTLTGNHTGPHRFPRDAPFGRFLQSLSLRAHRHSLFRLICGGGSSEAPSPHGAAHRGRQNRSPVVSPSSTLSFLSRRQEVDVVRDYRGVGQAFPTSNALVSW